MRVSNRLSAVKIARLTKPGRYCDGHGLWLQIAPGGSKAWLFRFMRNGVARQMGLGPLHTISLSRARELALQARQALHEGRDPIEVRKANRQAEQLQAARAVTFKDCAERYLAAHEASWRNPKHRAQWRSTLETYAYPKFGPLPVADIDVTLVLSVLEGLWQKKSETASRVRGRIESILDWAAARGYRDGANPARWRGHIDKLLPARSKIRQVRHHPALPYRDMPAFVSELQAHEGISALALRLTILTAARTAMTIGATWSEFNFAEKVWNVPAERMKHKKPFTVPLSDAALATLAVVPRLHGCDYLFPGTKRGSHLSNAAMLELMRGMRPGFVPHGFRSSFRDWAAEQTSHPAWVAEAALAHVVADKVEAAYRRGELLEKRRILMGDWAAHCILSGACVGAPAAIRHTPGHDETQLKKAN